MIIEKVPTIKDPALFDCVVVALQKVLADNLNWLDHSFGRAERLIKAIRGHNYYTPNIYISGNEYLDLTPDSGLGNYSFFVFEDPESYDWGDRIQGRWKTKFSIVFWFDLRTVSNDASYRNINQIKADIINILRNSVIDEGWITINQVYEKAENIFDGYTLEEVDNQFLMHPYAGLRFEGEMTINQPCI